MPWDFSYEPREGDYLEYDGSTVKLLDEDGFMKDSWGATSGVPGSTAEDQDIKNYGPIPEGEYGFYPENTDHYDWYDLWDYDFLGGDWGNNRVELNPTMDTSREQFFNNIERDGLFLHGGKKPGTKGCIDLGEEEEDFFNTIRKYKWLSLKVKYGF